MLAISIVLKLPLMLVADLNIVILAASCFAAI